MHAKFVVAAIICVSFVGCGSGASNHQQSSTSRIPVSHWYEDGTLQNSTLGQWRIGSYKNRLASSADFAAYVVKSTGRTLNDMDDLRPIAVRIEHCISEAAGKGGKSDAMVVSDVAATCIVLMGMV